MPFPTIEKNGYTYEDLHFEDLYFRSDILGKGHLKSAFDVFRCLILNSDSEGNVFLTHEDIRKKTGLSIVSVRTHLKKLIALAMVEKIEYGFHLNPEFYIYPNQPMPVKLTEMRKDEIKRYQAGRPMVGYRKLLKSK